MWTLRGRSQELAHLEGGAEACHAARPEYWMTTKTGKGAENASCQCCEPVARPQSSLDNAADPSDGIVTNLGGSAPVSESAAWKGSLAEIQQQLEDKDARIAKLEAMLAAQSEGQAQSQLNAVTFEEAQQLRQEGAEDEQNGLGSTTSELISPNRTHLESGAISPTSDVTTRPCTPAAPLPADSAMHVSEGLGVDLLLMQTPSAAQSQQARAAPKRASVPGNPMKPTAPRTGRGGSTPRRCMTSPAGPGAVQRHRGSTGEGLEASGKISANAQSVYGDGGTSTKTSRSIRRPKRLDSGALQGDPTPSVSRATTPALFASPTAEPLNRTAPLNRSPTEKLPAMPEAEEADALEMWKSSRQQADTLSKTMTERGFAVDHAQMEPLRKQNRELSERLEKKNLDITRLREKLQHYHDEMTKKEKQNETQRAHYHNQHVCDHLCCLPLHRLEKAGLNVEPLLDFDARWAGYVFGLISANMKASGLTCGDLFKKHRNSFGKIDEAGFKEIAKSQFPSIGADRLTRLFYFVDVDGSGSLNFLEFLRIFACDVNGRMGEEYFEHVMASLHRHICHRGGICNVFQVNDRHLHGTLPKAKFIHIVPGLGIGLNRNEAYDIAVRFDKSGSGEIGLKEFSDVMKMCASSSFVTDDWVRKLFDQVVTALHRQSQNINQVLSAAAEKGELNKEDFKTFLTHFQPGLREGQVDRVYGYLAAGSERELGTRNGLVNFGHFFHLVFQRSLGPTRDPATSSGQAQFLPSEITERLAIKLRKVCGSLSKAFDVMRPCLFLEEFSTSLQALGLPPHMDFEHIFNLLDVQRNGRIEKTTFVQVLEHNLRKNMERLEEFDGEGDNLFQLTDATATPEAVAAACTIQRMFSKRQAARRVVSKRQAAQEKRGQALAISRLELSFHLEQQLEECRKLSRLKEHTQMMPAAQFRGMLNDQQRAINRIVVLERELDFFKRQHVDADSDSSALQLWPIIKYMESANRVLIDRLAVAKKSIEALHQASITQREDDAEEKEAKTATVEPEREKTLKKIGKKVTLVGNIDDDQKALEEIQVELVATRQAKEHIQEQLLGERLALQEELSVLKAEKEGALAVPAAAEPLPESSSPIESLRRAKVFQTQKVNQENVALRGTAATDKIRVALRVFNTTRNVKKFIQSVMGVSFEGRFVIHSVMNVESDSLVLRCSDTYMKREVAVKIPFEDEKATRNAFLRECCIYAHLSGVYEVQDMFHFPGLTEPLVYCVMELLQGALLSKRIQAARAGDSTALPVHDAAEICDALLYGLEECHIRGVVHLDIKPSVIWEMVQPAGVVVKILDFGLARINDPALLTHDAREFFRQRTADEADTQAREALYMEADGGGDDHTNSVPHTWNRPDAWEAFTRTALLPGVGSPWYMSPARWCELVLNYEACSAPQEQQLRWIEAPVKISSNDGMRIEHGPGAGEMDCVLVRQATDQGHILQGELPAPHLAQGAYFEVVVRKIWPLNMLAASVDKPNGPVGFAMGFTRVSSTDPSIMRARRAWERAESWVIGYDGRLFENGVEVADLVDVADKNERLEFLRTKDEATASSQTPKGKTADGDAVDYIPVGPLKWSFAQLTRNDRVGLLATEDSHLCVYVNGAMISMIKVHDLDGACQQLYPVVEICGRARELGLEARPHGPLGQEQQAQLLIEQDRMVKRLVPSANHVYADTYAAAVVAHECFSGCKAPAVPPAFTKLLMTTALWMKHGRPKLQDQGDLLISLTRWCKMQEERRVDDVPQGIGEVLARVFGAWTTYQHREIRGNKLLRTVQEFRAALNVKTSCSHITPEFLRSHTTAVASSQRNTARRSFARQNTMSAQSEVQHGLQEMWDLTPWQLSASHVRRVVLVLRSHDGKHISLVKIAKLEPNIPIELKRHLCASFQDALREDQQESQAASPRRRRGGIDSAGKAPRLQFEDVALPVASCPISFARLRKSNAADVVLRFVARVDLSENDINGPPAGPSGAKDLADALRRNSVLEEVAASGQAFGDAGAALLGLALPDQSRLMRLDLRSNGIEEEGTLALAKALETPGVILAHLELAGNSVGSPGCCHLAAALQKNEHLKSLGLQRNGVGQEGAVALAEMLFVNTTLEELDIGRNEVSPPGAGAIIAATRTNMTLTTLNLQDNRLDVTAAVKLAEALRGDSVSFPPGSESSRHPRRSTRDFRKSRTLPDVKAFRDRPTLTGVNIPPDLVGGMVTMSNVLMSRTDDEGKLLTGSALKRLDLRHNALSSTGAATLLGALRFSTQLTSVSLAWNNLGLEAATAVAELLGPGSHCALKELDLRDNHLGEGAALGVALAHLAAGTLEHQRQSHRALRRAGTRKAIRDDNSTSALGGPMMSGRHLERSRTSATSPLRGLGTPSSIVSGETRTTLGPSPLGRTLTGTLIPETGQSIREEGDKSDAGSVFEQQQTPAAATPAPWEHVQWLNLANCAIDVTCLSHMAVAMPCFKRLETLLLYNNIALGSLTLKAAKEPVAKEQPASIGRMKTSPAGMIERQASIDTDGGDRIAHAIVELQAGPPPSAEVGIADFVGSLAPSLRRLSLGSCALGNALARTTIRALRGREALAHLDLSDNTLGSSAELGQDRLCQEICDFLRVTPGIQKVDLTLNSFGDRALLQVAKTLCFDVRNPGVDLSLNKISGVMSGAIRRWVQLEKHGDNDAGGQNTTRRTPSKQTPAEHQASQKARDDTGNQVTREAGSEAAGSAAAAFETVASLLSGAPFSLGNRLRT